MNEYIFQSIIEHATDAVVVTDTSQIDSPEGPSIVFVNDAYVKMTGYSKEEVIGGSPKILQGPETDQKELNKLRHALKVGQSGHAELINYKKNGERFWTSISIFPVREKSTDIKYWVGIKRDITAQRRSFNEIKSTFQELHHRVKNNLAIISALIELQAQREDDEHIKSKLLASTCRIKSIAETHEILYKGESLTHVDINKCIKILINEILNTLQPEIEIKTMFDLQKINSLSINQAVPLSLIVNEVISNCIRHAFKEKEPGKIHVNLSQKNNEILLKIKDNGQGLPKDFDPYNSATTGFELVNILSQQLKGSYQFVNLKKGTEFKFQFIPREVKGAHSGYKMPVFPSR